MAHITIDQVTKIFRTARKETHALSEASLEVADGEVLCIVGPSGCGKTTLLNLVAGFHEPTSGTILVEGQPVRGPSFQRAVVFQSDAVFPWLSVQDNVGFGLAAQQRSAGKRQRVERYLDLVGLSEFAHTYPKELSGGMRKRVDLARAYASGPEVLLLDEPFGALDLFTKESMWLALKGVTAIEPKTIIFVTHDIEEALFLGDRVVVMTPRPARIHSIVDVPFGKDRELDLRTDSTFQQMRADIANTLRKVHHDAD